MKTSTVAGCALCLVIGAGAMWFAKSGDADEAKALEQTVSESEEALETATAEQSQLAEELRDLKARARVSERTLEETRKQLATAQAELENARAAAAEAEPADRETTWRDRVAGYPAFTGSDLQGALEHVEWPTVAENMNAMVPLLESLADSMQKGEDLPAEVVGKIQQHNGPLVTVAMTLDREQVPGTGPNGSFTHPAFMANAAAATLEARGLPLSKEQSAHLARLEVDFAKRDAARLAGYGDDVIQLRRIVDESKLKHGFFTDLFALLSDEQAEALSPAAVRGRTSIDLFNEGLLWAGRASPRAFRDDAELATAIQSQVITRFGLPEDMHDEARNIVASWAGGLPLSVLDREMDPLVRNGMMMSVHVTESADHFAQLFESLASGLTLDDATAARIRDFGQTIVTYRAAADDG